MSIQKECSNLQEADVARILSGKIVAGSGCGGFDSGDVDSGRFLIECKTVTKPQVSFSIKYDWLTKIRQQAFEEGKDYHALAVRFAPTGRDYIMIDIDTFAEMKSVYEKFLDEEENQ